MAEIYNFQLNNSKGEKGKEIISMARTSIFIEFNLKVSASIKSYLIVISFYDQEMKSVALISSTKDGFSLNKDKIKIEMENIFAPGKYSITTEIIELKGENKNIFGEYLLSKRNIGEFISVGSKLATHCPIHLPGKWE